MQAPTCQVCGTKHWGAEHVFPQSPQCPKCGEQTGVDRTGKARWCKCVRDTAAAADQIIRKVMGKPLNGKPGEQQAQPMKCVVESGPQSEVSTDIEIPKFLRRAPTRQIPENTNCDANSSNTGEDEPEPPSPPEKDIVVDNTVSLPVVDAAKIQPSTDSAHRKKYMQQYMKDRRQRERDEKQRAAEAGTGATDQ